MKKYRIYLMSLGFLILAACSNPYKTHFVSVNEQMFSSYRFPIEQLAKNEIPKIYATDDMYSAEEALLENGYILIGSSKFKSTYIDKKNAIAAAREKGASIVVVKSRHTQTITETIPFSVRQPDQRTTVRETRYNNDGAASVREKTITVEGEYQTQYVQKSTDYYDYQATFWAKMRDIRLGLFVADLTNEQKYSMQTNRGVSVKIVIKDSPAFYADVLKGDIFTHFNDERINERKHFFKMMSQHKGQEVTLKGFRNGNPLTVKVRISE